MLRNLTNYIIGSPLKSGEARPRLHRDHVERKKCSSQSRGLQRVARTAVATGPAARLPSVHLLRGDLATGGPNLSQCVPRAPRCCDEGRRFDRPRSGGEPPSDCPWPPSWFAGFLAWLAPQAAASCPSLAVGIQPAAGRRPNACRRQVDYEESSRLWNHSISTYSRDVDERIRRVRPFFTRYGSPPDGPTDVRQRSATSPSFAGSVSLAMAAWNALSFPEPGIAS